MGDDCFWDGDPQLYVAFVPVKRASYDYLLTQHHHDAHATYSRTHHATLRGGDTFCRLVRVFVTRRDIASRLPPCTSRRTSNIHCAPHATHTCISMYVKQKYVSSRIRAAHRSPSDPCHSKSIHRARKHPTKPSSKTVGEGRHIYTPTASCGRAACLMTCCRRSSRLSCAGCAPTAGEAHSMPCCRSTRSGCDARCRLHRHRRRH